MKAIVAVLCLAALASAASIDTFRAWAKEHGKMYSAAEEAHRFAIFKENLAIIERLNLENHGAVFGPNKFTDLTNAEFKGIYTTNLGVRSPQDFAVIADNVKGANDWTKYLPDVKDQAQCGSCWAFSTVGNAEGVWNKAHDLTKDKEQVSLSEQQLVSCDKTDSGCNGGLMTQADDWIVKSNKGGLADEKAYPYTSGTGSSGTCKTVANNPTVKFSGSHPWGKITSDDQIITYLDQYGPLSIAIEADKPVFQSYTTGVLDSTQCGTTLDHGVTLVGYGDEGGKPYWLVRNSWGKKWGLSGYIKLVRGKNMCGLNAMVSSIGI